MFMKSYPAFVYSTVSLIAFNSYSGVGIFTESNTK